MVDDRKDRPCVVFVCTANMCRSPMAEYTLRGELSRRGLDWDVRSAGVSAPPGMPASYSAILAMDEVDIDINEHRSQPLTRELVDAADLIVVMTKDHAERVVWRFPDSAEKLRLLRSFVPGIGKDEVDVPDPIGLSDFVYRGVRNDLRQAAERIIAHVEATN